MLNLYWNFCYSFCTFQSIDKNNNEKRTFISNVAAIRQSRTNNFSNIIIWQVLMFVYCFYSFFFLFTVHIKDEPNQMSEWIVEFAQQISQIFGFSRDKKKMLNKNGDTMRMVHWYIPFEPHWTDAFQWTSNREYQGSERKPTDKKKTKKVTLQIKLFESQYPNLRQFCGNTTLNTTSFQKAEEQNRVRFSHTKKTLWILLVFATI